MSLKNMSNVMQMWKNKNLSYYIFVGAETMKNEKKKKTARNRQSTERLLFHWRATLSRER